MRCVDTAAWRLSVRTDGCLRMAGEYGVVASLRHAHLIQEQKVLKLVLQPEPATAPSTAAKDGNCPCWQRGSPRCSIRVRKADSWGEPKDVTLFE